MPLFDSIYYRVFVHTQYFPLQQLAYYSVMLMMGFTFINLVNLRNERSNPFKGSDGTYSDFKITFLISLVLFISSSIVILRQTYDLSSYCEPGVTTVAANIIESQVTLDAPLHKIFASIEKMNYLG